MVLDQAVSALDVGAGAGSRLVTMHPNDTGEGSRQVVLQPPLASADMGANVASDVAADERASDEVRCVAPGIS